MLQLDLHLLIESARQLGPQRQLGPTAVSYGSEVEGKRGKP